MLQKLRLKIIERHGKLAHGAVELGISPSALSNILHGNVSATPAQRARIIGIYGRGVFMKPRGQPAAPAPSANVEAVKHG